METKEILFLDDSDEFSLNTKQFFAANHISVDSIKSISELDDILDKKNIPYSAVICDMDLSETLNYKSSKYTGLDILRQIRKGNKDVFLALYSSTELRNTPGNKEKIHVFSKENSNNYFEKANEFAELLKDHLKTANLISEIGKKESGILTYTDTQILQISKDIKIVNDGLFELVLKNPRLIHEITWRRFEELIAELLEHLNYRVFLGSGRKDGGKDMLAFKKDPFCELVLAVECKHYSFPRKVGRPDLQQLFGVVQANNYNAGILATSSFFTNEALEFTKPLEPKILLKDIYEIEKILKEYQQDRK